MSKKPLTKEDLAKLLAKVIIKEIGGLEPTKTIKTVDVNGETYDEVELRKEIENLL